MYDGLLIVSPELKVESIFRSALSDQGSWLITTARSYRAALFALGKEHVAVVVCDETLPDGNWRDLLGQLAMLNDAPRLVVMASPDNPALWAEAISLGAYDVLAKPLADSEIRHVCAFSQPRLTSFVGPSEQR